MTEPSLLDRSDLDAYLREHHAVISNFDLINESAVALINEASGLLMKAEHMNTSSLPGDASLCSVKDTILFVNFIIILFDLKVLCLPVQAGGHCGKS